MQAHSRRRLGVGMIALLSAAVGTGLSPTTAGAAVVGACGAVEMTSLSDLRPGAAESSTTVRVIEESTGRVLREPITVDVATPGRYDAAAQLPSPPPVIPAGTAVDSYLVHSDPVGRTSGLQRRITLTLAFASNVKGIIVSDRRLDSSDAALGATTAFYPTGNAERGLELAPRVDFVELLDLRTVRISVNTTTVIDQIRIVTAAVPPELAGGYRTAAADGGVFSFGSHEFHGSTGSIKLNKPMVGGYATCSSRGYWLVASDGGIFAFGDARFYGSTGNIKLNQPIVGMAPTPSGAGYWLVASDGGIFAFGDARFQGSTGNIKLNRPMVGMAATRSGGGYWLVASDGGIFAFGDARFFGSTGNMKLNQPIVAML